MLFSVLTRKSKVPRHNLHPPGPVLAKRRQISGGSSLRARFPHPAQLSSLREPGTQSNWPSVSSGHTKAEGGLGLTDGNPGRWPPPSGHRNGDEGEAAAASRPGPKLAEGLSEGSGALQGAVPSLSRASRSRAGPRLIRRPQSASWSTRY